MPRQKKTTSVLQALLYLSLSFPLWTTAENFLVDDPDQINFISDKDQDFLLDIEHTTNNNEQEEYSQEEQENNNTETEKNIADILITGNQYVAKDTILTKLPYKTGDLFRKNLSAQALKNLYSLGFFRCIEIYEEEIDNDAINLHIIVEEKTKLANVEYKGNKNLKTSEIEKKTKLSEVQAIDEEELTRYALVIKKLYAEKNYHEAIVNAELCTNSEETATAVFTIIEGKKSLVKRVCFTGNKSFQDRKLRSLLFTREDWLLSALDRSGTYHPEAIEQDKRTLEDFYQSNGFLAARVTSVDIKRHEKSPSLDITFNIEEGPLYTVTKVSAPGNEILTENQILSRIAIRPGQLYSIEAIKDTMETLRLIWGEYGYIYADIDPNIQPNHEDHTVTIEFNTELGSKISLNRIIIKGNRKTRDKVIRRNILLDEGDIITTFKMDESKRAVGSLGYFDQRDGVNWRIQRLEEGLADLELIVKEVKTGKLYTQISYGGVDKDNPSVKDSLKGTLGFSDRNFLGTGVSYDAQANLSYENKDVSLLIANPWLFNRPILGSTNFYHKQTIYDDVESNPVEVVTGGALSSGLRSPRLNNLRFNWDLSAEKINFTRRPIAPENSDSVFLEEYQNILNRRFESGTLLQLGQAISQDLRNSPIFPTRGYYWTITSKLGAGPAQNNNMQNQDFGYVKNDFDVVWYTPLINEFDLVFAFHFHAGAIARFNNKTVPYRELYHIGGPTTVRGFLPGEIEPTFAGTPIGATKIFYPGTPIGATKIFYLNNELIFPLTKDLGMKARLFYDGGAGWNTIGVNAKNRPFISNNNFHYRHAIGFGIQMVSPQPIRIDVGFKLDRNKKRGEKPYEVAFTMAQDFW